MSVVAPVYNEEGVIEQFHARVTGALGLDLEFELVLVDDGSTDATPRILEAIADVDQRVRVVSLSRNFGHQTALTAGLDHARGDVVVMLDADLQDPPELIVTMLKRWAAGCDVVYAVRDARAGESRFKLTTARWFYSVFDRLAQIDLGQNAGDFRLLDRHALDGLLAMRERHRFLRGMTVWVGYTQAAVPYSRDARYAGKTKFTPAKMLHFSLDAILSFSERPLQFATLLGLLISLLAFVAIPVVIVLRLLGHYLPGFGTITIVVLLLGGIQLISIGIIGEYVGRIYDEVKGRPLYLVRAQRNLPATAEDPTRRGTRSDRRVGAPVALSGGGRPHLLDAVGGARDRLQDCEPRRESLDRLGDRVGKMDPVGIGSLGPAALDPHQVAGVADDGRIGGDVVNDDGVGADLRAVANRDRSEHLGSGTDGDVVLERRVSLAGGKAGTAERDALVERHVVADLGRLTDHDAHPVVDEEAVTDARRRMNLDSGHRAGNGGDEARQDRHPALMQRMGGPVGEQRVHARPRGEDRQRADPASRRVPALHRGDIAVDLPQHRCDQALAKHHSQATDAGSPRSRGRSDGEERQRDVALARVGQDRRDPQPA